jgi:hypothetical protein
MGATNYRIARYGVVHAHLTATITPSLGVSEGLQWTVKTLESVDITLSLKYSAVGGTQISPVAIALSGSEPKWNGEMSFGEVQDIRRWMGPGWASIPVDITFTWQLPGQSPYTDYVYGAYLGDDGTSSKKDGVVMTKVGSNMTAFHPLGIDPFALVTS